MISLIGLHRTWKLGGDGAGDGCLEFCHRRDNLRWSLRSVKSRRMNSVRPLFHGPRFNTIAYTCQGFVMDGARSWSFRAWLLALGFGAVFVMGAYLRGEFLLGRRAGVVYALVAILATGLILRAAVARPLQAQQLMSRCVFTFLVSLAFAFPTVLNRDLQHFVDLQATNRAIRSELKSVFAADKAFGNLAIETTQRKCVCVTVSGSVASAADFDRLRTCVSSECPSVEKVLIHWEVSIGEGAAADSETTAPSAGRSIE